MDYAVIRGGRIYTLRAYRNPWGQRTNLRWVGYCEGNRIGFFRTKKDFDQFVNRHAVDDLSPQQLASIAAEEQAATEGLRVLDRLRRWGLPIKDDPARR